MPKSALQALLSFVLLGLISGCALPYSQSSGTPIDEAKVSQIVKGKTTRAEIETMFGKPINTMMLPDGRRALSYSYTRTKLTAIGTPIPLVGGARGTTQNQTLQIYLSKEGIVEDYEFTDNTQKVRSNALGGVQSEPQ